MSLKLHQDIKLQKELFHLYQNHEEICRDKINMQMHHQIFWGLSSRRCPSRDIKHQIKPKT